MNASKVAQQVSQIDPEIVQDFSPVATLESTSKVNSEYMIACKSSGLTSNPFANSVERSKFSENQHDFQNNLTAMQLNDSFSDVEHTPPNKRQKACTLSATTSQVGGIVNVNIDNVDNTNSNTKHVSFSPMLQEEAMVQGPPITHSIKLLNRRCQHGKAAHLTMACHKRPV